MYIAANREIEKDPAITRQVDTLMQLVEDGDAATVKKLRREVSRCLDGFAVTLKDLNVSMTGSSGRAISSATDIPTGSLQNYENSPRHGMKRPLRLDLSEFGFENKYVIRRSDGTSVYAARDLAFHTWKAANFNGSLMCSVPTIN